MTKVLITGITGFLGAEIAQALSFNSNYQIIALKREKSDLWRCKDIVSEIIWVDISSNWEESVINLKPEIIVHSAWSGVSSKDRDDWEAQFDNLFFLRKLLSVAKTVRAKKFLGFGSQAEYGVFSGIIDEDHPVLPVSTYGVIKKISSQIIESFCQQNGINWYWLRLFSFFGEKEADDWLIPTLVKSISENKEMNMTPGEQKYAYMYVKDLSNIIFNIIKSDVKSGIYNLSSDKAISLIELTNKIINIIQPSSSYINFGAIRYRENQPMHIQGDNSKLKEQVNSFEETDFNQNLENVVNYIIKRNNI